MKKWLKKHFIYMLAASLVLAAPAVTFTSCGDDDPEEIPGGGGGDDADDVLPNEPSAQNPLTSHEQKQKLEAIAKGFQRRNSTYHKNNNFAKNFISKSCG